MDEPSGSLEVQVLRSTSVEHFVLRGRRITVGRAAGCDLPVSDDPQVSRVHAVIEWMQVWTVRDCRSRNGTFLNGRRVSAQVPITAGAELRMGSTRLLVRGQHADPQEESTDRPDRAPILTARERELLIAMLLPLGDPGSFNVLSSPAEIARRMGITDEGVRQHLSNLYQKFGVSSPGGRPQADLANEAVRRQAITLAEIREAVDRLQQATRPAQDG